MMDVLFMVKYLSLVLPPQPSEMKLADPCGATANKYVVVL